MKLLPHDRKGCATDILHKPAPPCMNSQITLLAFGAKCGLPSAPLMISSDCSFLACSRPIFSASFLVSVTALARSLPCFLTCHPLG